MEGNGSVSQNVTHKSSQCGRLHLQRAVVCHLYEAAYHVVGSVQCLMVELAVDVLISVPVLPEAGGQQFEQPADVCQQGCVLGVGAEYLLIG